MWGVFAVHVRPGRRAKASINSFFLDIPKCTFFPLFHFGTLSLFLPFHFELLFFENQSVGWEREISGVFRPLKLGLTYQKKLTTRTWGGVHFVVRIHMFERFLQIEEFKCILYWGKPKKVISPLLTCQYHRKSHGTLHLGLGWARFSSRPDDVVQWNRPHSRDFLRI